VASCEKRDVHVTDVLFEPKLNGTLLSVSALTEKGCSVSFVGSKCTISSNDVIIGEANRVGQLYRLQLEGKSAAVVATQHNPNCQHMWHRRMDHRDVEAIKRLADGSLANEIKVVDCGIRETCESCLKGKMTKKPFPQKSTTRSKCALDLIHADLCGPMPTATPSDKRYVMTLRCFFSLLVICFFTIVCSTVQFGFRIFNDA
jgi:hypothetical protein